MPSTVALDTSAPPAKPTEQDDRRLEGGMAPPLPSGSRLRGFQSERLDSEPTRQRDQIIASSIFDHRTPAFSEHSAMNETAKYRIIKRLKTWTPDVLIERKSDSKRPRKGKRNTRHPLLKAVATWLAILAEEDGRNAYPSLDTLAEMTGYDRATVCQAIKTLIQLNVIELQELRGRRKSNTYRFTTEWTQDKPADTETKPQDTCWNRKTTYSPPQPVAKPKPTPAPKPPITIKPGRSPEHPTGDFRWVFNLEHLRTHYGYAKADQAERAKQMTVSSEHNGCLAAGAALISIP
ncbi:MAG TPA: helix-turn-helix domain-containing protein [Oculatellaceae cyanobacterium]